MTTTMLYLIRHAQAEPEDGHSDPPLTALGERQAGLLGDRLRSVPFAAVEHSPLRRATETARLIGGFLPGVPVRPSEFLRDLTPMPAPGKNDEYPADRQSWLAGVPENERDPGAVRLSQSVAHYTSLDNADPTPSVGPAAVPAERHYLLVTHAFVLGWFVRHALDAPVWRWLGLNSADTGLTIIRCPPQGPVTLVGFNDVSHLAVLSD
jgi:serine/threonine-protein phosphatase PGAM5